MFVFVFVLSKKPRQRNGGTAPLSTTQNKNVAIKSHNVAITLSAYKRDVTTTEKVNVNF